MARRIPYQRAAAALRKANGGQSLSRTEQLALDNLQTRLGLARPLASYAPRTQRRYLKAAREGTSASEINRAEYGQRANAVTGAARSRRIEQLRARLAASSVDASGAHSPDTIEDLKAMYGDRFVLDLLIGQVHAVEAYNAGHPEAGRARWAKRGEFLSRYRRDVYELDDVIDPYFYYHGSIS